MTPAWRPCEFQERELFDRSGPDLDGRPGLRRSPVRDGFKGQPMWQDSRLACRRTRSSKTKRRKDFQYRS
jgi:NADH:ubiquinone oxidoreductase subunit C